MNSLLDHKLIKNLGALTLNTKFRSFSLKRGIHYSNQIGQGIIFSDRRAYIQGDDSKNIDWKHYGKTGKLFINLFEEDSDLPIYIFMDASNSMMVGNPNKITVAKKLCFALSYIAMKNQDRIFLNICSSKINKVLDLNYGKNHFNKISTLLDDLKADGKTNLKNKIDNFFKNHRHRGLVIVISDFFDMNINNYGLQRLSRTKHDVAFLHVDCDEDQGNFSNQLATLVDSETEEEFYIGGEKPNFFKEKRDIYFSKIINLCHKYSWNYINLPNYETIDNLIFNYLRRKKLLM